MNLLDSLYLPAAIITAPWWARKTRGGWGQRLGIISALPPKPASAKRVLLHAVSVGETNTLRGLVPLLRQSGLEVVVSAGTDTGLLRAQSLFAHQPGVYVVRYPLDFSGAVARFLDAVDIDAAALVELEVWPNFVAACAHRHLPVCVINGRLSARSFRGYQRIRRFLSPTFARLAFVCVQDHEYAQRFERMGVPRERVLISGSMKWDAVPLSIPGTPIDGAAALARELGIDPALPLIVAGSTAPLSGKSQDSHGCEESLLNAAVPQNVQLLCAPRRPEHYAAAFAAMGGADSCVRRSDRKPAPTGTTRFLLDTIGELRAAYALADLCIIGRSFDANPLTGEGGLGGSDPVEPIALGKPALIGPSVHNFRSTVAAFESARAIRRVTPAGLGAAITELLNDPYERQRLAAAGRACVIAHQGATQTHADNIRKLVVDSPARARL